MSKTFLLLVTLNILTVTEITFMTNMTNMLSDIREELTEHFKTRY